MPRTPLREAAGVTLFQVEEQSVEGQVARARYEVVTPAAVGARMFEDERAAHRAFERGLAAASGVRSPAGARL